MFKVRCARCGKTLERHRLNPTRGKWRCFVCSEKKKRDNAKKHWTKKNK